MRIKPDVKGEQIQRTRMWDFPCTLGECRITPFSVLMISMLGAHCSVQ